MPIKKSLFILELQIISSFFATMRASFNFQIFLVVLFSFHKGLKFKYSYFRMMFLELMFFLQVLQTKGLTSVTQTLESIAAPLEWSQGSIISMNSQEHGPSMKDTASKPNIF